MPRIFRGRKTSSWCRNSRRHCSRHVPPQSWTRARRLLPQSRSSSVCGATATQRQCIRSGPCADSQPNSCRERGRGLAERTKTHGVAQIVPRFHYELADHKHSSVNIATVGKICLNCTRLVTVPYLRNKMALVKGEELFLELVVRDQQVRHHQRTWRDVQKAELTAQTPTGKTTQNTVRNTSHHSRGKWLQPRSR